MDLHAVIRLILVMTPSLVCLGYFAHRKTYICKNCFKFMKKKEFKEYHGVCKECQESEAKRATVTYIAEKKKVQSDVRSRYNDKYLHSDLLKAFKKAKKNSSSKLKQSDLLAILSEDVDKISPEDMSLLRDTLDEFDANLSGFTYISRYPALTANASVSFNELNDVASRFHSENDETLGCMTLLHASFDHEGNNLDTKEGLKAHEESIEREKKKEQKKRDRQKESYEDMIKDIRNNMR